MGGRRGEADEETERKYEGLTTKKKSSSIGFNKSKKKKKRKKTPPNQVAHPPRPTTMSQLTVTNEMIALECAKLNRLIEYTKRELDLKKQAEQESLERWSQFFGSMYNHFGDQIQTIIQQHGFSTSLSILSPLFSLFNQHDETKTQRSPFISFSSSSSSSSSPPSRSPLSTTPTIARSFIEFKENKEQKTMEDYPECSICLVRIPREGNPVYSALSCCPTRAYHLNCVTGCLRTDSRCPFCRRTVSLHAETSS